MNQTHKITDSVMTNRALLCAWVLRNQPDESERKANVILKDNYYLMQNVKDMAIEESIAWLENVESVISQLYLCDSTLKGDKRKERLAWLATLIRTEYKESAKLPAWVNPLLSVGNLDSYESITESDKKTGKKTNKPTTIQPIGAAIVNGIAPYAESAKNSPSVTNTASPVTPRKNYMLADIVELRAGSVTSNGSMQVFTCENRLLKDIVSLRANKSFVLNDLPTVTWLIQRVDIDTDKLYCTWSVKSVTTAKPTTSRKGSKASVPTTSTSDIDARMSKVESDMGSILAILQGMSKK